VDDGGRPERHPDLIPRLRQIAMILVFDLGGPLLAYSLLRSAGMSVVASLVISGVLPALGIGISALADRRVDVIGIVVLAGLLAGTLLGLTSHNARLYLLEGWVPPAVFALGCLLSLRLRCHGCLAVSRLPAGVPDDHRGVGGRLSRRGRHPRRDRGHHVDGDRPGLLQADPYVFAVVLSAWTLVYGEHEKRKAERLATASADAGT
jgi:hypothetical protein